MPLALVAAVLAVSGGWRHGDLVVDGPGMALYLRLVRGHLLSNGQVPYWVSEMWAGSPVWALGPSLPVFALVPFALAVGPDNAVKLAILAFQAIAGCGAYALARSLWGRTAPAALAGFLYALHPILISHGALAGAETSLGVMAASPWLVLGVRRGLRGDGTRYLVLAGIAGGLAVLHEAEFAYGLALLCACLLAVELGRVRGGEARATAGQVLSRAGVTVAIAFGVVAYWILPFRSLQRSFVLSPPELVRGELFNGIGARVSHEMGSFFHRSSGLTGSVSFDRTGLLGHFLYLSWVCVAASLVTAFVIARTDEDGHLTAILLASALGVWVSTGAFPLATGGPVLRGEWLPMIAAGLVAGLVVGSFVRRLHLGSVTVVAVAASAVLLLAVPYLTPFLSLQRVVPLLSTLRFPRFYVIAPLGLALGAAYPVTLIHRWVPAGDRQTATLLSAALCLALAGAFLVDIRPYRSFYRVREPHSSAAYRQAAESLAAAGDTSRVAIDRLDPRSAAALLDSGHELSVGWPHPVASGQLWRLTIEPYLSPPDYRDAALGLSATGYLAVEQTVATGTAFESVRDVRLLRNPKVLPLVRAYPQALVVRDRSIAPELATSLAYRNVAVVTGDRRATRSLGGVPGVTVESGRPCSDASTAGLGPGLAGDVATACAMHSWLGVVFAGIDVFPSEGGPGAVFTALADGLRGVSVWLDRPPGRTQVTVHELEADGRTPGREVARALSSGTDANGLTTFAFDPVAGSAGHRYVFRVSCAECALMSTPGLITGPALRGPGDLVVGQQLRTDRVAAFTPVYDRLPSSPSATTELRATRPGPGRWVVEASGSEPALVVVAEARFPGWRARVDGRAVPVLEADGAFLGVPVPAGRHRVTLEYRRPAAAVAGRLVTVVTLVALAVVAVRRRGWVVPPPGAGRPPPSGGG